MGRGWVGGEMQQGKGERDSKGFYLYVCLHPFSLAPLASVTLCITQTVPFCTTTTSSLGKGQAEPDTF